MSYISRRLSVAAFFLLIAATTVRSEAVNPIRVRLFAGEVVTGAIVSDADGDELTIYDESGPLATLGDNERVEFDIWNEFLRARWRSGSVPTDHAYLRSSSGRFRIEVDGTSNEYRGSLELVLDGDVERPSLILINEVELPDYVSSVLPAEYGFKEIEGVKAQAIVVRTYALRAKSLGKELYDVTDDTGSQVYNGVSSETTIAREAVEATAGMTLQYRGELIEAVYSAHCGGHSADNEDVWSSKPIPYLRGREDPYDAKAPVARWESRLDRKAMLDMLSRTFGVKVKDIKVEEHGSGDRATSIRLETDGKDVDVSAQSFRVAVNDRFGGSAVKSTFFELKKDGDDYRFLGRGLGHGVGLCQWGAAEQAREGRSYKDILTFYYKDVSIEGFEASPPVASNPLSARSQKSPDAATPPKEEPSVDKAAVSKPPVSKKSTPKRRSGTSRKESGRRVGW